MCMIMRMLLHCSSCHTVHIYICVTSAHIWNRISKLQALKDLVRKHGNGNFPLILAFYRRKCIRVWISALDRLLSCALALPLQ